jgi:hypothetical protein
MDTVGSDVGGFLPIMQDLPPRNEDGTGGMHMYMPWWNYKEQRRAKCLSRAAITSRWAAGAGCLKRALGRLSHQVLGGGYGVELKKNLRKIYGCDIGFSGRGEMIPNEDSYCEIDPNVVDQWGIPVLRFHFKWSQDEILQAKHMQETFQAIIEQMGGVVTYKSGAEKNWGISVGGEIIHEVGATQMGSDPKKSVLNQYCQAWDCKNLFITDAAPFVSNADKNPTLTHHRARLADVGLHRRSSEEAECEGIEDIKMADINNENKQELSRRAVFQVLGAAPVMAGGGAAGARANGRSPRAGVAQGTVPAQGFRRPSMAHRMCAVRLDHPRRRAQRQRDTRRRAGVYRRLDRSSERSKTARISWRRSSWAD